MIGLIKQIAQRTLPPPIHDWLVAQWYGQAYLPPVGKVNFGNLRRVAPLSQHFGYDRGLPIDRYYIENFLTCYAKDIQGCVIEIKDNTYTQRFGGAQVVKSDVLDVNERNPQATIIADLTCADNIPSNSFDCFVLTQTLHMIYDVQSALKTIYRILKPGGVLLATFPGISQVNNEDDEWNGSWYWHFTTLSARRLFEEVFPRTHLKFETHGNVLTATSFLQGLAVEELTPEELDYRDRRYEVSITVRAVKPEEES